MLRAQPLIAGDLEWAQIQRRIEVKFGVRQASELESASKQFCALTRDSLRN
jgi:hypothetical protein